MTKQRPREASASVADPAGKRHAFAGPEAVRDDPDLTTEEKIRILERWAYDDAEMGVALEEGMPPGDAMDNHQQRVWEVLNELATGLDMAHTSPSKQHGIPSGSLKSR